MGGLIFCLKRVKRCLNRGKNEQKVSDSSHIPQFDKSELVILLYLKIADKFKCYNHNNKKN